MKAHYYVMFQRKDLAGKMSDVCGTDGYFRPDQRLTLDNMVASAKDNARWKRNVMTCEGFRVVYGTILKDHRTVMTVKFDNQETKGLTV